MSTTDALHAAVRALDADLAALLHISNLAYAASTATEMEVIHLQGMAAGIEALANQRIDLLIHELDKAGTAAKKAEQ